MHDRLKPQPDHTRHDRLLVARFAAGDVSPAETDQARMLVATCPECASLAADLHAIANQMHALPAARRPRDFRISPEQAERLRGSFLQRLLRTLAGPGWTALRPVAGVAMSIGLVLAVVGAAMPGILPAAAPAGAAPNSAPRAVTDQSQPTAGDALLGGQSASSGPLAAPEATPPPPMSPPSAGYAMSSAPGEQVDTVAPTPPSTKEYVPETIGPVSLPGSPSVSSPPAPLPASPTATPTPALPTAQPSASPAPTRLALQPVVPAVTPTAAAPEPAATAAMPEPASNVLIYAGLAMAAISLAILLLALLARRRYADPLLR